MDKNQNYAIEKRTNYATYRVEAPTLEEAFQMMIRLATKGFKEGIVSTKRVAISEENHSGWKLKKEW